MEIYVTHSYNTAFNFKPIILRKRLFFFSFKYHWDLFTINSMKTQFQYKYVCIYEW